MHDIYYNTALPPYRVSTLLIRADYRIDVDFLCYDLEKILAIVETDAPDRNLLFYKPDEMVHVIAAH